MKVSVIISSCKATERLSDLIQSICALKRVEMISEVLTINNSTIANSEEQLNKEIERTQPFVLKYFHEPNPGLHNARHRGAKEAKGDVLCFLDDDVTVEAQWIEAVYETFTSTDAVLVGGKIMPKYEVPPPDWVDQFWRKHEYGKWLGHLSLIDLGDEIRKINPIYIFGCNFSMRKDILFECGGFHPDMFPPDLMHYRGDGETGLALRIKEKGYAAYYNPGAVVYHHIPKERLTVEYFCERAYRQGISDSFSEIRSAGGIKDMIGFMINNAYREGKLTHRKKLSVAPELLLWTLQGNYLNSDGGFCNQRKLNSAKGFCGE